MYINKCRGSTQDLADNSFAHLRVSLRRLPSSAPPSQPPPSQPTPPEVRRVLPSHPSREKRGEVTE